MKKKIFIELNRNEKNVSVKIKIPQELENFFSELSDGETNESEKWFRNAELTANAKFYANGEQYRKIEKKLAEVGLHTYNDFGDGLVRGRAINLAPLRTLEAGSEDGIILYSAKFDNSGIDFEMYIRELALAVKAILRDFISKNTLKAVISYEV